MKRLPEAEQELMMIIWEYEEPVSRFQIEEKLDPQKEIAPSTILTLLTRLEKRGFLEKVKNGKSNLYRPLVKKEDYTGLVGKTMLDKMFQGSLANFAAALYQGKNWKKKKLKNCRRLLTGRNRRGGFAYGIVFKVESSDSNCRRYSFWCPENFREKAWTPVEKNCLDHIGASDVFSMGNTNGNCLAAPFYNLGFEPPPGKTGAGGSRREETSACSAVGMVFGRK